MKSIGIILKKCSCRDFRSEASTFRYSNSGRCLSATAESLPLPREGSMIIQSKMLGRTTLQEHINPKRYLLFKSFLVNFLKKNCFLDLCRGGTIWYSGCLESNFPQGYLGSKLRLRFNHKTEFL